MIKALLINHGNNFFRSAVYRNLQLQVPLLGLVIVQCIKCEYQGKGKKAEVTTVGKNWAVSCHCPSLFESFIPKVTKVSLSNFVL